MPNITKAKTSQKIAEVKQQIQSIYESAGWLDEPLQKSEITPEQTNDLKASISQCTICFDSLTSQVEYISDELCLWARATGYVPLLYIQSYLICPCMKQVTEKQNDLHISYLTLELPSPFKSSDAVFVKLTKQNPKISSTVEITFLGMKGDNIELEDVSMSSQTKQATEDRFYAITFDKDFVFRKISGNGIRLLGIEPEVLIGQSLERVLDPAYEHQIKNSIELNRQGISTFYKSLANQHLVEIASFPIMKDGELESIFTVNYVRSGGLRPQDANQIRRDTFNILSELDSSSFLLLDADGIIVEVNKAFINYLSSELGIVKPVYGQNLLSFFADHDIVPEQDLLTECYKSRLKQSARRLNVSTSAGHKKWNMRVQHTPVNDQSHYFVNITDVTANYYQDLQKEQKTMILDAILNNAHLAIMVTDAQFRKVLLANPEMHKLTQRSSLDELDQCLEEIWVRPADDERRKLYEQMLDALDRHGYYEGNLYGDLSRIYIKRFVQRFTWDGKEWNIMIDTDRREEVAIRKSSEVFEQRFKAIFDYSSIPTAVYDTDTYEFIEVNKAALDQYGFEATEASTMRIIDLWPEELKEQTKQKFEQLKQNNDSYKIQVQHQLKSGQVIDVEVNSHALDYELYHRPARLATAIDISENLKTTLSLIDQKAILRTILDQIPYPIFLKDSQGKYLIVNQRFIIDSNTAENLIIGFSDQETFATTELLELYTRTDQAVLNGQPVEYEHTMSVDGVEQHFLTIKRKVDLNDQKDCILGISTNITARKKAERLLQEREQLFQDLFKSSPDALFLVDEGNGGIIRTNQTAIDLFEADSEKQLEIPLLRLIPEMRDLQPDDEEPIRCKTFKNKQFWGSIAISTIDITGYQYQLIRVIDVTESTNLFNRIEDSLKEKDILLREIHHRVKNNLSVIVSLLSLQSAYTTDPVVRENYADSMNRIRSMAILHEELYKNTNLSRIDIRSYVSNLAQQIASSQQLGRSVKVLVTGDEIPLDIVKAVPCGLILNELITNSFKHAFKNTQHPTISIELHLVDGEALINYQDNGCGKGTTVSQAKSTSLGTMLISELSKQLKAFIEEFDKSATTSGYGFKMKFLA